MKYKLIGIRGMNQLLDCNSDYVPYILTYLTKRWYYFGKIKKVEHIVYCPDYKLNSWMKSIEIEIEREQWRKK